MTKTAAPAATATPTEGRKRFSFGPVWSAAVVAGSVTDHEKLIAHAVKLKVGARSDMKRLKFDTLLAKVSAALATSAATTTTVEPAAETTTPAAAE